MVFATDVVAHTALHMSSLATATWGGTGNRTTTRSPPLKAEPGDNTLKGDVANDATNQGRSDSWPSRVPPRVIRTKISGGASGKWPFQQIEADILDPSSIAAAVVGSRAVVNAVSLYVERGEQTFERVHVKAATRPHRAMPAPRGSSRFRASARIRSPVLTTSAPGAAARRL